jgi:hypothetical protein
MVSTWKKSIAAIVLAWADRNCSSCRLRVTAQGRCRRPCGSPRWWRRNLVPEARQLAADPPVSPGRVVAGHLEHEPTDRRAGARASWCPVPVGPAAPDQCGAALLAYCGRAPLPGRAAMCTRSGMAATRAMPRRRSSGGWPRCRACSAAGRCGIRLRRARSRAGPGPGGQQPGSEAGCCSPGPAETPFWAAGPRAAAAAPWPGPRRDRGVAGELPH